MAQLVDLEQVSASRSDRLLFADLSLTVSDGERIGVVGVNGTGKSTLLRVVAGVEAPESGTVRRGRGARVGYLEQDPALAAGTVASSVAPGWQGEAALERLGMGAERSSEVSSLSGGQAKRVALAAVLAVENELLVLDEPTNHLDLTAITWLEQWLSDFRGGLVLVSHDRFLLDAITTKMLELDRGHHHLHEGGYASYLEARAEREEAAASAESVRRNLARRELAWLRRGAKARSRKPQARVDAARRTIAARAEAPARAGELELAFGTPRLGDKVIDCVGVSFSHGAGLEVLHEVDLEIAPRERLGVVGANGSGKSTLLDLLAGRVAPSAGRVEVGPTVVTGYYDQRGVTLDDSARVRELVAGPTRALGAPEDVALMERFWFTGELPFARVGTLSGGERRRLQLLLVLAGRPNVLLLDEPTNDLDLDTLRVVEDFLDDWPGALVIVSHDRAFLERTTERAVALEGGRLTRIAGGVSGWIESHGRNAGPDASGRDRPRASAPARPSGAGAARPRSTSTLARLMRDADKELVRLTRRRDELAAEMGSTLEHEALAELGSALTSAQRELEQAEERWIALAEEAESAR